MKNEASIVIDRPIDKVFEYTNNHVAEWSIVVVEDELLEETEKGIGSRFRVVTEDRGKRMDFQGEVTNWDPPTSSGIHMVGPYFDIFADYLYEDLGGSTRVTQKSKVNGKGFTRIMLFLTGWMMKRASCDAQNKELESLKQHCESKIPAQ